MIDGDNEQRKLEDKEKLNLPSEDDYDEYDILYEAEYPYWDVIGLEDRWLPSKESFEKAMNGRFDACIVRFVNVGQLLVPWTRKKFKAELLKFHEEYTANMAPQKEQKVIHVKTISPEQYKKITGE